jgi:hypothetical protein
MAGTMKCAHPACNCTVEPKGPFGKYCSDHCKQAGDKIELRCDCQHPPCRAARYGLDESCRSSGPLAVQELGLKFSATPLMQ